MTLNGNLPLHLELEAVAYMSISVLLYIIDLELSELD